MSLHPAEERLSFSIKDSQLVGSARTSGAGPGYHAFVVELLEALSARCRLRWTVTDTSGYWDRRHRGELEDSMGHVLQRLIADIDSDDPQEGLWTLNFPAHRRVIDAPYPVLTPSGPWDETQIDMIRAASHPRELASLFPWWGDKDARYWMSVGQSLRWMEVIWTPYDPPGQREVRRACRDAFTRARALDPGAAVPHAEMERIDELLSGDSGHRLHALAPSAVRNGRARGGDVRRRVPFPSPSLVCRQPVGNRATRGFYATAGRGKWNMDCGRTTHGGVSDSHTDL